MGGDGHLEFTDVSSSQPSKEVRENPPYVGGLTVAFCNRNERIFSMSTLAVAVRQMDNVFDGWFATY